jgi:hypothetical protein
VKSEKCKSEQEPLRREPRGPVGGSQAFETYCLQRQAEDYPAGSIFLRHFEINYWDEFLRRHGVIIRL